MWRSLLCLSLGLAFAGFGLAEDKKNAKYQHGQIVRVNALNNTMVIRVGTGTDAKEQELKVSNSTKFFGSDKQPLSNGLKSQNFKDGTDVWFMTGADDKTTINELRLYDPALPGGIKP